MKSKPQVLSLVENGWRGARQCSLWLSSKGIPVTHLIKGRLSADIRALIRPYPNIYLKDTDRWIFRPLLALHLVGMTLFGGVHAVLVDQPRTLRQVRRWCRRWGIPIFLIEELPGSYQLWREDQRVSLEALHLAASDA